MEAFSDVMSNKNLHLGIIPNEIIIRIKNEITYIKKEKISELFKDDMNYALTISQREIKHIKKESLTIDDVIQYITTLSDLIVNFDTVRYTLYNNSQNGLRFRKKMNDGVHIVLEIISNKKHTLFLESVDFQNKKRKHIPNA